jgi:CheY-like chemotaxis protein
MLKSMEEKLLLDTQLCGDGLQAIKCAEENNILVAAVCLDICMLQIDSISTLDHFRSN